MAMTAITAYMSDPMLKALGEFAAQNEKSMTEVIREAVANHIKYDRAQEPKRTRQRKYANETERQNHYNQIARERRKLQRKMLNAQTQEEWEEARDALRASLGASRA